MTTAKRLSQRQRQKCRKTKGEKVKEGQKKRKVSEKKAYKESKGSYQETERKMDRKADCKREGHTVQHLY